MISVIVPVYNSENLLERCIDSILAQTFKDFELILVDDGSEDSSGSICDRYARSDARIRVIHKSNGGVSSARNSALKIAKGQFVAFCDSDDYVTTTWLQTFIDNIGDNDICIQAYTDRLGDFRKPKPIPEYQGTDLAMLIEHQIEYEVLGYVFVKLFRTSIIRRYDIKFDEEIHYCEDELFVVEYLKRCNTYVTINRINYFYTPPTSIHKYRTDYILPVFKIMSTVLEIYKNKPTIEIVNLRGYQVKDYLINQLTSDGRAQKAATQLYRAFFRDYHSNGLKDRMLYCILVTCGNLGVWGRKIFSLIHLRLVH